MNKKKLLLSSFLLIPTILVGCDVFKSDKDIVLTSVQNFKNLESNSINANFDFPHTSDWNLAVLNNSVVTINTKYKGADFDSTIISSDNETAISTVLDISSRDNKLFVSSDSLLEQIGGELKAPKDFSLSDFEGKFISEFDTNDFNKLLTISSVPLNELLASSDDLPKEAFAKIEEPEINTPYTGYSIALSKEQINQHFKNLSDNEITKLDVSVYIDEGMIKNAHFEITSDFNHDQKEETLFVFNEFNPNPTELIKVNDTITLNDFLTFFSLSDKKKEEDKEYETNDNASKKKEIKEESKEKIEEENKTNDTENNDKEEGSAKEQTNDETKEKEINSNE